MAAAEVTSAVEAVQNSFPGEAVVKSLKAKKRSAPRKPRVPLVHPPYVEMVGEAITSLKERTGSSQYAIAKFMEDKHKAHLPSNFRKLLLVQLKKLTASGRLTKVKNSYKLPAVRPRAPAKVAHASALPKPKPKPKPKAAAVVKPKPKRKPAATAKPKLKPAVSKPKAPVAKPKPKPKSATKAKSRPAKAARTSAKGAPGRKAAAPAKRAAALKKVAPKKLKAGKAAAKPPAKKARK